MNNKDSKALLKLMNAAIKIQTNKLKLMKFANQNSNDCIKDTIRSLFTQNNSVAISIQTMITNIENKYSEEKSIKNKYSEEKSIKNKYSEEKSIKNKYREEKSNDTKQK